MIQECERIARLATYSRLGSLITEPQIILYTWKLFLTPCLFLPRRNSPTLAQNAQKRTQHESLSGEGRLLYEAHVTVQPLSFLPAAVAAAPAHLRGWRSSNLPLLAGHCSTRAGTLLKGQSPGLSPKFPWGHDRSLGSQSRPRMTFSSHALLMLPAKLSCTPDPLTLILPHYLFKLAMTIYSSSVRQQLLNSPKSGALRH